MEEDFAQQIDEALAPKVQKRIRNVFSGDPNEKTGPLGVGEENFVADTGTLNYTVYFENDPESANAAAQVVLITDQLSADLDWDTFDFGEVAFGDRTVVLTGSPQGASARVLAIETGDIVDIQARFDRQTGLATWTFTTIDIRTGEPTIDPLAGFLPVNDTSPEGEGHVAFRVRPRASVTTDTAIANSATIVFDTNDPIVTNEHVVTFDFDAPTSSVDPLPAESPQSFTVSWGGTDLGSGIAFFDVFVSVDEAPYVPFVLGTTDTSAVFTGERNRQYAFYSVATDRVGHQEPTPAAAQAVTVVVDVTASDIHLVGLNTPNYQIADVTYDSAAHRATITLNAALGVDKLLLVVKDTITDRAGQRLDGEWIDQQTTGSSGDGTARGDFRFRFNVVPGDTNRSKAVAANDVAALRVGLGSSIGAALYSMFADLDGSGGIGVNDVIPLRTHLGQGLPAAEPTIPTAPVALAFNPSPAIAGLAGAAHAKLVGDVLREQNSTDSVEPLLGDIAQDVLHASIERTKALRVPLGAAFVA